MVDFTGRYQAVLVGFGRALQTFKQKVGKDSVAAVEIQVFRDKLSCAECGDNHLAAFCKTLKKTVIQDCAGA